MGWFKSVFWWQTITPLNWSLIFIHHLYWTILSILVFKKVQGKITFQSKYTLAYSHLWNQFCSLISKEKSWNFTFYQFAKRSNKVAEIKYYKQTFFRIMVPAQKSIKARLSLLQVISCTTPACEIIWTTTSPLFHLIRRFLWKRILKDYSFKLKNRKKRKLWSAVLFPYKTWDISSRSRATTATDKKAWCTCKLSCCLVNLNLLLLTVSFVAIVFP